MTRRAQCWNPSCFIYMRSSKACVLYRRERFRQDYLIGIFKLELHFTSRVLQIPTLHRRDQLLSKYLMRFRTYKAVIVQSSMSTRF